MTDSTGDGFRERREGHWVQTTAGQTVQIIVHEDIESLKTILLGKLAQLTRWLIGVGLVAAFSLGFWAASLRAELNAHATAIAALNVNGSAPVQSIREDLAATREKITALQQQMERLEQILDRRP